VKILKTLKDRYHAWDTETIDVSPKTESPVGKGKIICASAFCGPDVDFGNGPRLFIDNFAQNKDLILEFKEYLEDERYRKLWHNYGYDRHVNSSILSYKFVDILQSRDRCLGIRRRYDVNSEISRPFKGSNRIQFS